MSKKMVFQNTDKLFYVATYTDEGDFSSLSEKGYETSTLANSSAGLPEGTPTGEYVTDEEVVEAQVPAPVVVEETPAVEAPATSEEVASIGDKVENLESEVNTLEEKVADLEAGVEPAPTEKVEAVKEEVTVASVEPTKEVKE